MALIMNNRKIKTILFFVLITSIVKAQNAQKMTTKDSIQELKELSELMSKYPNRGVFFPEEFGEQLIDSSKEELLRRLTSSKDVIELRKVAQVLGDREMAGTLKLTAGETVIIDNKIRSYILATGDFDGVDYSEVHSQIIRFWHLAINELLRNLENPNPHVRAFAFNTLVQVRNKNVVRIMINKAKACSSPNIKNMYIGTLGIMTQQENLGLPNRQTMNEKESQELFNTLIKPALKELSPSTENLLKD